jgi:hypothetical protein
MATTTGRRWAGAGAMLGALGLPAALLVAELLRLRDPVALVGLATLSAALNSAWPLGGGMLAQGTYRSRFVTQEWTHDVDRSASEGFAAGLLMGTVTALSFFAYLPILAELWLRLALPLSATVMTWLALALMVAITAVRHRAEQPLYDWRRRIEAGEAIGQEELANWVRAIATLAKPSGAIGHTGGIGARTVGLHEHLDAERVLRYASSHQVAGSTEVHARALDYLASCALPAGGFPAYPGGEGRLEYTARAEEALRSRLSAEQAALHRAFAERCRRGEDFARSPPGAADPEQARWGRALLSPPGA